jgi:uncharacterized protein YbaR (Trm112 family)
VADDPKRKDLPVTCPLCRGRLVVDADSGDVLEATPVRARSRGFDEALGALRQEGAQREEDFRRAFQSESRRGQRLDQLFERARERAGESGASPDEDDRNER